MRCLLISLSCWQRSPYCSLRSNSWETGSGYELQTPHCLIFVIISNTRVVSFLIATLVANQKKMVQILLFVLVIGKMLLIIKKMKFSEGYWHCVDSSRIYNPFIYKKNKNVEHWSHWDHLRSWKQNHQLSQSVTFHRILSLIVNMTVLFFHVLAETVL